MIKEETFTYTNVYGEEVTLSKREIIIKALEAYDDELFDMRGCTMFTNPDIVKQMSFVRRIINSI